MGACLALVSVPLVKFVTLRQKSAFRAVQLAGRPQPATEPKRAKVEPWGRLEAFEVPFANPNGVYPDRAERLQKPKWFFEGATEKSVVRFIQSCDLPRLHKSFLLNKKYWNITSNGCVITPPNQLLWFLTPRSREQIYTVLGKWTANYPQALPFHFSDKGFELRFQNSGLPPSKVQLIERLTYRKWGELCFSDLEAAEDLLEPAEFQSLLETLYAIPAYALRLHVGPDSDVAALVRYWGRGGREKRIAPLLTALAKVPGGEAINLTSLLPPFARLRLYTYPDAWEHATVTNQDCFYSALNFFNETEDTNLVRPDCIQKALESEYVPNHGNPLLGDLMVLLNPELRPVHACIYIADNFVFTKNGMNPGQPWVLMRLPDILPTYFAPQKPGRILCLRHKNLGPA
jgi:hypothetical protein